MIPRYSRPEMARIWAPQNRFRIWLEIETHACDAQAALGVIPESAARAVRERGAFDLERIDAHRARDPARRHRLSHKPRRTCWLGSAFHPSGHDLERCARHRFCGPARRRRRPVAQGSRGAAPGAEATRHRAQIHADHRPQSRHPCRADELRPQACGPLCRIRPRPRPARGRAPRDRHLQDFGCGRHLCPYRPGGRGLRRQKTGPRTRTDLDPGDPA